MKLRFEEWAMQKRFSINVTSLFAEAFTCYRNTAYRASMLFSYLAFFTILKELIIKSAKPVLIEQGRWDAIVGKLQNDDTWEKTVFEELTNSSKPIFNINEDIRQQIKYWKDRRNDCAHFKTNEIESHHTESFWSFVKSNLSKITIEGGKESLLNKFQKHFDPTFTPPDADVSYLIKEIDESILSGELSDFWQELIDRIDHFGFFFNHQSTASKVINRVFELCNERTKENLAEFIKTKKLDLIFISNFPDKINVFDYSTAEIREIWRTRIWNNKSSCFLIYRALLRNSLVAHDEIDEANKHIIAQATTQRPEDDATHFALASNRFGDSLFNIAIVEKRLNDWFLWVNPRADMITYYIEKYPLRDETVEVICEMYTRSRYSHWLGERLVRVFEEDANKKAEFHAIAARRNFIIPSELT